MTKTVEMTKSAIVLGRGRRCDVAFADDPRLSREHAKIQRVGDDYVLIDNSSTNGTFVNGSRVARHTLRPGDEIVIGGARLTWTGAGMQVPDSAVVAAAPRQPLVPPARRRKVGLLPVSLAGFAVVALLVGGALVLSRAGAGSHRGGVSVSGGGAVGSRVSGGGAGQLGDEGGSGAAEGSSGVGQALLGLIGRGGVNEASPTPVFHLGEGATAAPSPTPPPTRRAAPTLTPTSHAVVGRQSGGATPKPTRRGGRHPSKPTETSPTHVASTDTPRAPSVIPPTAPVAVDTAAPWPTNTPTPMVVETAEPPEDVTPEPPEAPTAAPTRHAPTPPVP